MMIKVKNGILALAITTLCACETPLMQPRDNSEFMPLVGGEPEVVASTPLVELRKLQLISTNLVSALVQVPEMKVGTATLQVSNPTTAFGNTLIRALEDAGFGIQRVSADQGLNYVTYGKRLSETEAGQVTDYSIAVGEIEVRREYNFSSKKVFPSSLLLVTGTDRIVDIVLDDTIFTEQGGSGDTFISGVGGNSISSPTTDVNTVTVNDYDATPIAKRKNQSTVLSMARQRVYSKESAERPIDLGPYSQLRRTVLIFDDKSSTVMGRGNKLAVTELASNFQEGDVFAITACTDVDGKNAAAELRAVRVEEEFVSHNVSPGSVQIEPCVRASYRHKSDQSPVAVSVVQFRKN